MSSLLKVEKHTTKSPKETQRLAARMAKKILRGTSGAVAVVLALQGNLGAGKTTFVQGFAGVLGIKEKILSPTFILMRKHIIKHKHFKHFYHIDCYRLKDEIDLKILGVEEIMEDPRTIIVIEWPERVKKILPKSATTINFKHGKNDIRFLTIKEQTGIVEPGT
jgi:tRNA threonylcarbamoyladenosine biosynthesis protein TsaE